MEFEPAPFDPDLPARVQSWVDQQARRWDLAQVLATRDLNYWAFLRDPDGHTLELSHGQEVGLTRERVRQIQVEALKRLRQIMETKGLTGDALFS